MKSLRNRVLAIAALGIATICANASPATAQAMAFKGSFTLPNEVRWQGATLPAGDYTFSLKSASGPDLIQLQGPKGGSFVISLTASKDDVSDRSVMTIEHRAGMTIEHRAGMSIVRELYLAQIGLRLHYYVPKPAKDEQLAQGPVTTEQVLVAAAK